MPKQKKSAPENSNWDSEVRLLAWLATCVSVISFLFYFQHGQVLLYGDAVAHMNIARRVFDSKTPGLLQLGTVWLPLPHLLMIPFIISMKLWRTGLGGSIPSMAAYVLGVIGIYRLTRTALSPATGPDAVAHASAWIAALTYAANPNLIYMQSTAMGESLYLALFIWAVVYLNESFRGEPNALTRCALYLAAACLTRYDGWFLTVAVVGIVLLDAVNGVRSLLKRESINERQPSERQNAGELTPTPKIDRGRAALKGRVTSRRKKGALAPVVFRFLLIAAAAPTLWLAYNGIVYKNPLEFENGPYSAKAIEKRTQSAGNPGHPGSGNLNTSTLYFLKAAQNNVAENIWLQRAWIGLLLIALAAGLYVLRATPSSSAALLLLLIPLPFYALSIAYGGVPIFIPQWWPFSHYNTRYGLQMLPAFAVAIALLMSLVLRSNWQRRLKAVFVVAILLFVSASYSKIWRSSPITLQEAEVNMRTRNQLEKQAASWLEKLPNNATLLMYLGDHVGAVQQAGIPLSHTINEGNHRVWKQPVDTEGLWERALANPPQYVDYVLAFEGDPVYQAVHDLHLRELVEIHVSGQARAVLYRAR
jgi:hypothetical protein